MSTEGLDKILEAILSNPKVANQLNQMNPGQLIVALVYFTEIQRQIVQHVIERMSEVDRGVYKIYENTLRKASEDFDKTYVKLSRTLHGNLMMIASIAKLNVKIVEQMLEKLNVSEK